MGCIAGGESDDKTINLDDYILNISEINPNMPKNCYIVPTSLHVRHNEFNNEEIGMYEQLEQCVSSPFVVFVYRDNIICMYVYMYVCMYVWMDVCMYVWMYVCMNVCMYAWLYYEKNVILFQLPCI